jgi:hypothetical protein
MEDGGVGRRLKISLSFKHTKDVSEELVGGLGAYIIPK